MDYRDLFNQDLFGDKCLSTCSVDCSVDCSAILLQHFAQLLAKLLNLNIVIILYVGMSTKGMIMDHVNATALIVQISLSDLRIETS